MQAWQEVCFSSKTDMTGNDLTSRTGYLFTDWKCGQFFDKCGSMESTVLFSTGSHSTSTASWLRDQIKRGVKLIWVGSSWTFTHLWLESWPSACSAPVWPPCSSAAAWSGSRALSGSSAPQPETYPPDSCPGRRPVSVHQSPGPAGAPWRERCGRMRMRRGRSQRVQSYRGRPWRRGL